MESPAVPGVEKARTTDRRTFAGHIAEFDGFRGTAVWFVFLAHFFPASLSEPVKNWLQVSWFLMDGFFVLSGFLIVGTLLDSSRRPDFYRRFYLRRALRILPAYYTVLILLTVMLALSGRYRHFVAEWGSPAWFYFYFGNIPSVLGSAWPPVGAFIPLWSLQLEEQFYLLTPLLVRQLSTRLLERTLWGLVLLSPLLRLCIYYVDPSNPYAQYAFLACRFEGFALGSLMALRFRTGEWVIPGRPLSYATLALLGATVFGAAAAGFDWTQPFNRIFGYLLASLAWAGGFLWLIKRRGSKTTAWLRSGPVQYCGKVSYGIYLLHWPVSITVAKVLAASGLGLGPWVELFLQAAASVAAASLCWHFVESPVLGLKDRFESAAKARAGASTLPANSLVTE